MGNRNASNKYKNLNAMTMMKQNIGVRLWDHYPAPPTGEGEKEQSGLDRKKSNLLSVENHKSEEK